MKQAVFVILGLSLVSVGCSKTPSPVPVVQMPAGAVQVTFPAADGQKVYGDFYAAGKTQAKTVLLMFHQAGSNAGEYTLTAPQFAKEGYDCLAIDQRSGGNMFHRENRTKASATGKTDYMAAYSDLQGAVVWAEKKHYANIIPWGSSYSASLTLKLLGDNPKLKAGLVFSPGEYFGGNNTVKAWAAAVKAPVYFVCTPDELRDGRQELFDALGDRKESELIAYPGSVHGSSTTIQHLSPVAAMIVYKAKGFLKEHVR